MAVRGVGVAVVRMLRAHVARCCRWQQRRQVDNRRVVQRRTQAVRASVGDCLLLFRFRSGLLVLGLKRKRAEDIRGCETAGLEGRSARHHVRTGKCKRHVIEVFNRNCDTER